MLKYDKNILIKNIQFQMSENNIKQQQLADAIGMSQPNLSKALNPKEKKNFTVAQLVDIADQFDMSVDSLLGRKGISKRSLSPRSIARFLVQLIENGDAAFFDYKKEEDVYELDDASSQSPDDFPDVPEYVKHHKNVMYPAFYLPSYWYIPSDADDEQREEMEAELWQLGNGTLGLFVNDFLQHFRKIYAIYKDGALSEDTYHYVVEDMLNSLHD